MVERSKAATEFIADQVRAALARRDLTSLQPILAGDVRWASCVGSSQVIEWMQRALSGGADIAVGEVSAHDDRVLVDLEVGRAKGDTRRFYQVLFVDDGKIVEIRDYDERSDALAAGRSGPSARPPVSATRAELNAMAAILPVRDLAAALEHYGRLGFTVSTYEGGGYGYARRGAVEFHLTLTRQLDPRTNTSAVYLFVDDADALYAEWRSAGVTGQFFEPGDTDYGLREAAHVDRDGNQVRFGSPLGGRSNQ